jgi:hypothetical protein
MERAIDTAWLDRAWKWYVRQKGEEEDAGVDTAPDTERMREVFKLAAKGELTDDAIKALFPDTKEPYKQGVCGKCDNTGLYFDPEAKFKMRAQAGRARTRIAPGMVLCECFEGRRRREIVKKGPQKKKRGI